MDVDQDVWGLAVSKVCHMLFEMMTPRCMSWLSSDTSESAPFV